MDDIKRMAAVMLVLILIIANLAIAVVTDFTVDDINELKRFTGISAENTDSTGEDETEVSEAAEVPEVTVNAGDNESSENTSEDADSEENSSLKSNTLQNNKQIVSVEEYSEDNEAHSVITVDGNLEGLVDKKVFHVTLPVQSSDIEYIADPQGLISKTQTAAYPDSWFDPGSNVFFNHGEQVTADGTVKTSFDSISEPFTVVNKSSCAVAVVARVSAVYRKAGSVKVALAADNNWTDITKPSIYLTASRSDDFSEKVVVSTAEQVITASVCGCPGAYCYRYNDDGTYSYELMSDSELDEFRKDSANSGTDTTFRAFSITLQGECNEDGEWDPDADYDFPSVSIIWNVGLAPSASPCVIEKTFSVARDTEKIINYSFGAFDSAADAIVSAVYITPEGTERDFRWNNYYLIFSDNFITATPEFSEYVRERNGGILRIRFNDSAETTEEITLDLSISPYLEETECTLESGENKPVTIRYSNGSGDKAAEGISKITFGNTEFSSKVYSSVSDGEITLNVIALRMIRDKKGGTVSITFDDAEHTRCSFKIKVNE